jgi:hypothetical protein
MDGRKEGRKGEITRREKNALKKDGRKGLDGRWKEEITKEGRKEGKKFGLHILPSFTFLPSFKVPDEKIDA